MPQLTTSSFDYFSDLLDFCTSEHLESVFIPLILNLEVSRVLRRAINHSHWEDVTDTTASLV